MGVIKSGDYCLTAAIYRSGFCTFKGRRFVPNGQYPVAFYSYHRGYGLKAIHGKDIGVKQYKIGR